MLPGATKAEAGPADLLAAEIDEGVDVALVVREKHEI
jgi:hypothetical protein